MSSQELIKAGRPKSVEKRQQILKSASDLFLTCGYSNCSMEMVAKDSNVSKQTVYSHFNNKEALFLAVIKAKCSEYQLDNRQLEMTEADLAEVLMERGLQIVKLLHDEQVVAIYRVVIGEVNSNPRVAELFYQAGPKHNLEFIVQCFMKYSQKPIDEEFARKCAITFFSLLKGEFHIKSILGLDFAIPDQERVEYVKFATNQVIALLESKTNKR